MYETAPPAVGFDPGDGGPLVWGWQWLAGGWHAMPPTLHGAVLCLALALGFAVLALAIPAQRWRWR